MKTQIFKTYKEFLKRTDKSINGMSPDFAKQYPNYEKENETNRGCWNCTGCTDCTNCIDCIACTNCTDCQQCDDCWKVTDCTECQHCDDCWNCTNCTNCIFCIECQQCEACWDCWDCESLYLESDDVCFCPYDRYRMLLIAEQILKTLKNYVGDKSRFLRVKKIFVSNISKIIQFIRNEVLTRQIEIQGVGNLYFRLGVKFDIILLHINKYFNHLNEKEINDAIGLIQKLKRYDNKK